MTTTELYILTQRKHKIMKLLSKEFALPKAKRGNVAELQNRLSRIKDWLKEPVIRIDKPCELIPMPVPEYNADVALKLFYPLQISNTAFKSHIGIVQIPY